MDLKIKIVAYTMSTNAREVEKAVNYFMSQVQVDNVQVVSFLGSIVLHIFYRGEEPVMDDAKSEGE